MSYGMPSGGEQAHVQSTSTGLADVKTVTAPGRASACYLSAATSNACVVFDGTTPSTTNGMLITQGLQPVLIEIGKTIKFASAVAGNSLLNVTPGVQHNPGGGFQGVNVSGAILRKSC